MTNQVLLTRFRLDNSQAITQARQFEAAINKQNKAMVQTGASAAAMGRAAKTQAANMNTWRRNIGQASFQVADFAIVMQQGQDALRAFAIQGGQLAGAFGPLGAVIGGVITVGGLLLSTFLQNANGAKELEDALKSLRLEIDELRFGPSEQEIALGREAEALTRELEELERVIASVRSGFSGSKSDLEDINEILQEMVGSEQERRAEIQKRLKEIAKTRDFLEREKEALNDISGTTEGLAAANEALNDIYASELETQQKILGVLQEQVTAVVNRAKAEGALIGGYQQQLDSQSYGAGQAAARKLLQEGYKLPEDKSASSGGGASEIDKQRQEIERLLPLVRKAIDDYKTLAETIRDDLGSGFKSVVEGGISDFVDWIATADTSFEDFAKNFLRNMAKMILQTVLLNTVMKALGGAGGLIPFGAGGIVSSSSAEPTAAFAKGGVVNGPMTFPMGGGRTGLMGEAGPEAIMPLGRDSQGNLGVAGPNITINNTAGVDVSVVRADDELIEIAVSKSVAAVKTEYSKDMQTGSGTFSRSLEQGYTSRRRVT